MSEIVEAGGSMAMMVMGLGALGVLVALALAGMSFTKRRVPLAAWVLIPALICTLGALGAWSNAGGVLGSIPGLDATEVNERALAGLWKSLTIDWLSRWVAAGVLVVCAWCAGVGATIAAGPSEETALTPVGAGTAAFFSVVGALALGSYGIANGLRTEAYLLAGVILAGGLAVAFASSRRALYEHTFRVAGMRFTAAACFFIAASLGAQAVSMGTQIAMFGPNGITNPQDLETAVATWNLVADPVWLMAFAALGLAFVIAFAGIFSELGEIVQRFTLIDLWATGALLLLVVGARALESTNTAALADVGTHGPARDIFHSWGNDLPATGVTVEVPNEADANKVDKLSLLTVPAKGGYGDVIVFKSFPVGTKEDGSPLTKNEWRRTWKWEGTSWSADDAPLSCEGHQDACTPATIGTERVPLLAIGRGEPAVELVLASKSIKGDAFLLLAKGAELTSKTTVPEQLEHKQIGFIPVKINQQPDLEKEIWVDAGYKTMFWGPVYWFGEGQDKDPMQYADAIFADTQAPGIHVLVSPKARVEGFANSCVSSLSTFAEGKTTSSGKWCSMVEGDVATWQKQARAVWPLPQPETVKARGRVEGPVNADEVLDIFMRENAAVAYCQKLAHAQALEDYDPDDAEAGMAPTSGVLEMSVVINDRGKINGIYVEDKSKLENRMISGCIAQRYRSFTFDPMPKPPVVEGQERPEPPTATVYMTYEFAKLPDPAK